MFARLRENNRAPVSTAYSPCRRLRRLPRATYNAIVNDNIEMVAIENLPGRIAANSVIPATGHPDAALR